MILKDKGYVIHSMKLRKVETNEKRYEYKAIRRINKCT